MADKNLLKKIAARMGGNARAKKLSAKKRHESAVNAALARWSRLSVEERKAWRAQRDAKAKLKRLK